MSDTSSTLPEKSLLSTPPSNETAISSSVSGTEINAASRDSVKNALSITSANADAVVVTGSGEATDSAKYCDKLLDEAEKLRKQLKEKAEKESWYGTGRYNQWSIDNTSPHEIFTNERKQKEADHLRRCIELSLEIQEEYEKLDAAMKDLDKLNNMKEETFTKLEAVSTGADTVLVNQKYNVADEINKAKQQIESSLSVINKLENTQNAINSNTVIDENIKAAWKIDDRGFLKDMAISATPGLNAGDSADNAMIYYKAGRYGMAALYAGFATADTASTVATAFAGAGIISGAATGGVKAVVKASVKQALKRSTAELRTLFKVLKKGGQLITKRKALKEAAEKAVTCARACVTGH